MSQKRTVLVTGVAGYWGARVATRLVTEQDFYVVGVDSEPPAKSIKGLDFVEADVRNPLLPDLLAAAEVDTVCHLAFVESVHADEAAFDLNVMGTMKLLGACAQEGVRKVVLKSSTAVYGAQPTNSAFLTEEHPLCGSRAGGWITDLVEIEAFCDGFRRQAPQMIVTILRFPGIVGPAADTPMTRFLKEPLAPILLGFDPMMQVIHEDDVVGALVHAIIHDVPGPCNVAAEGVLPLTRVTALAGKIPVPIFHFWASWGRAILDGNRAWLERCLPIDPDYLRYPWVGDLSKMRGEFGFAPQYSAEEALRQFAQQQRIRRYLPESGPPANAEERLRDNIEQRRGARASGEPVSVSAEGENNE